MDRYGRATEPESQPTQDPAGARDAPRPPSVLRTALGVLFSIGVLALATWLISLTVGGFAYATKLAGVPGTFVATRCHTTGAGKARVRTCRGTFTSVDGGLVDHSASIDNANVDVGKPAQLRRESGGGYTQPRAATAALEVAGTFGIVAGAAVLLCVPCVMVRRVRIGDGVPVGTNPPPWGFLLRLLPGLFAGFLVLAALSLVAALLIGVVGALI
ncbi:hypothetical protein GCM10023322_35690 [Rugosimonospora acidiphila]|uniref:Uncharacterized protein n=1 Tax=Rugosimonospora acidiphila TaxID=556531 RepID=A0ABP9RUE8_9ACTN